MPTRTRTHWKPRSDGQFDCRVGWKINGRGKREQHRFRVGTELKEAKRRDLLLRQMWDSIEQSRRSDPLWDDDTLTLAKLVAGGTTHVHIPRIPEEEVVAYSQRVLRLRHVFPMLAILPELEYGAAFGVQLLSTLNQAYQQADHSTDSQREARATAFGQRLSEPLDVPCDAGPTLHEAMRDFMRWLENEYSHPESGVTPWGRTQIGQVESLIAHHADLPLAQIQHEQTEAMIRYWRQRPFKKGSKLRVTRKSASHYISALRNFFKWLHSSPAYNWRKPADFHEIKTRVVTLDSEQRRQVNSDQVFTLDELVLLYRYGAPLDRLLILLGLNCGFGSAESASLLVAEIFLRTPHPDRHRVLLDFESTEADSFIKRVRRKNRVYGEFLLFNHTLQGIEWALRRRKKQAAFGCEARLLLNGHGEPYDKPTRSGNANRQIPNRFARLLQRITDDEHPLTRLPFKMLRKTGGDLVKRFSNGEIAGVFLCHGQPVATDDLSDAYTQRPFGKVFAALRAVERHLQPMFDAAGPRPFLPQQTAAM